MLEPQSHTDAVLQMLKGLEADQRAIQGIGIAVLRAGEAKMYGFDFLACVAVKRCLSVSAAMVALVNAWNLECARALLRMHIDTALRFAAGWLVDNPHDFAFAVLRGEKIDKQKCRDGKPLKDFYLVEKYSVEFPWLPDVYKNLSGYVHFSGSHFFDTIARLDDSERTFELSMTADDRNFPEASWMEVLECFRDVTAMLARYLQGYAQTKDLGAVTPMEGVEDGKS